MDTTTITVLMSAIGLLLVIISFIYRVFILPTRKNISDLEDQIKEIINHHQTKLNGHSKEISEIKLGHAKDIGKVEVAIGKIEESHKAMVDRLDLIVKLIKKQNGN